MVHISFSHAISKTAFMSCAYINENPLPILKAKLKDCPEGVNRLTLEKNGDDVVQA